jgi:glucose/arabinose dehydrogenase
VESLANGMPNPNAVRLVASGGGIVDLEMGPDGYIYVTDFRSKFLLRPSSKGH